MKFTNENKHDGLEKKDLRDFVAKTLKENNCFFEEQEDVIKKIRELEETLKKIKIRDSMRELMNALKWENFDVSDFVDYYYETYFDFIGTKQEYDNLKLTKETNEEPVNKDK
jgi:predicted nuclease with TOPRIM domain